MKLVFAAMTASALAYLPGCMTAGIDESDGSDPSTEGGLGSELAPNLERSGKGSESEEDVGTAEQAVEAGGPSNGVYRLNVRHSDMCLDVITTAAGAPVVQKSCNGNPSQKFILTQEPDGKYKIQSSVDTNLCVHMGGAGLDNGPAAVLWYCQQPRPENQKFIVGAQDGQGYACISPSHSNRPLTIVGSSMFEGALLYQYGAQGSCSYESQKFFLEAQ